MSLSFHDCLSPNQNLLPEEGFGNLIALPLQVAPRKRGNSTSLDDHFALHSDQWAFLFGLQRIDREQLGRWIERPLPDTIDTMP